jgi:alcohol dehydrogenase class IV
VTVSQVTAWPSTVDWWAGRDAFATCLRFAPRRQSAVLIVDAQVGKTAEGARLAARYAVRLKRHCRVVVEEHHDPATTCDRVISTTADRWRTAGHDRIVGVGGGAVMDLVKLATLPRRTLQAVLSAGGRGGLVTIPPGPDREASGDSMHRVLVPTTIGTGSEMSRVACFDRDGSKVLAAGHLLRGDAAVIDPDATAGLPPPLLAEGALEVLSRLLVPFTTSGDAAEEFIGDHIALADLAKLGELASPIINNGSLTADQRVILAALSGHSHAGLGLVGRSPFSSPLWYVATELAGALRCRKMQATALLLPAWAELVLAGRSKWGRPDRLRCAWRAVTGSGATPNDPAGGIRFLAAALAEPPPSAQGNRSELVALVGSSALTRWGDGLPALAGFDLEDVRELLERGLDCREASPARLARSLPGQGRMSLRGAGVLT